MRSFSTSVSRPWLPCIFSPFQLVYEAITDMHAGTDGGDVTGAVDVAQRRLVDPRVALVLAIGGAAVTQEMLGRGDHMAAAQEIRAAGLALQAAHHRAARTTATTCGSSE